MKIPFSSHEATVATSMTQSPDVTTLTHYIRHASDSDLGIALDDLPTEARVRLFREAETQQSDASIKHLLGSVFLMREYAKTSRPNKWLLGEVCAEIACTLHFGTGRFGATAEVCDSEAVQWARKATRLECARGMYYLGCHLHHGSGVERDLEQAYSMFLRGAQKGCGLALSNVYACLINGGGVERDLEKVVELDERFMEQNIDPDQPFEDWRPNVVALDARSVVKITLGVLGDLGDQTTHGERRRKRPKTNTTSADERRATRSRTIQFNLRSGRILRRVSHVNDSG